MHDLSRLCIHTATTKPLPIEAAIDAYLEAGVRGITVWRDAIEGRDPAQVGQRLASSGLEVVSLCRGGLFPAATSEGRQAAIEDNLRVIDVAAAIGAPLVVLVCGAVPGQPLPESRRQIADGISAVLPHAETNRIRLAIEPLHPMYADDRSAINTMAQAAAICDRISSPWLGIAVDVYHVWWDPDLATQIAEAAKKDRLFAFHICDWLTPTTHLVTDRGLMGEGCINIPQIRGWMEEGGFDGFHEVEIFSERWWATDQRDYLEKIKQAYLEHC